MAACEKEYRDFCEDPLYVDKTLFIKEFKDRKSYANIIVRPHGFGKSLNMSMLKTFYEKTDEDTSIYFRDKLIWKEDEEYTSEQGKYPVIYMSFAGVKGETWEEMLEGIKQVIADEFSRHGELRGSDKVSEYDLKWYEKTVFKTCNTIELEWALERLSGMLRAHYKEDVIVLIDDYDAPLRRAYEGGYLKEAKSFFCDFWDMGLKTNYSVEFGVLAGVLDKPASDGFNNSFTYTALDKDFSTSFGFTENEVRDLLNRCGCPEKYDEVLRMYGGFDFSGNEMFNSESVMKYLETGKAEPYYSNEDEKMIQKILESGSLYDMNRLGDLVNGVPISLELRSDVRFFNFKEHDFYVYLYFWGFLDMTGPDAESNEMEEYECEWYYFMDFPNEEMMSAFTRVFDKVRK